MLVITSKGIANLRQRRCKLKVELEDLLNEFAEYIIYFEKAKFYINDSLRRGFVRYEGTELSKVFKKTSPLEGVNRKNIEIVFQKFKKFVEKYKGVGL